MTDHEFAERLVRMRETMYRVSCSQLKNPADRDDAVQETLVKAWHNRHRLREERYMQTWAVRVLINECHNIHRKQKREATLEERAERKATTEPHAELYDALFRLGRKLRLPIVLHYIEGYHAHEIAKMLGVPKGTVLWWLSKARKELGLIIKEEEKDV